MKIAHEIAKCKKPFNIAETLVKPCLIAVADEMFGVGANAKIESIPLSRRTITRRVDAIAVDIEQQMCAQIKQSGIFALQFDESTDVANEAILLGFARYIKGEQIVEEMFCFHSLEAHTTGEDIFGAINEIFRNYELQWKDVVGVCTDSAPSMRGSKVGLITRIKTVANK